ncbi:MAG TPA: twin-arginine translocase TatA/TatE family subunit [Hellea balneolensis]|uniref:Sec-independent protein translocase protein TatA n=1 Tax=Hellea balneolensis TaxID=287478 RepID=A0A7V5U110_9PROT|nr:twin-arginine translocase TatA/TatE family subunit [Hellea balneolensis]
MSPSLLQLLIVGVIVLVLFGGRGKISAIMGDVAKGINSFKKGLKEDPDEEKAKEAIDITPPKDETKQG